MTSQRIRETIPNNNRFKFCVNHCWVWILVDEISGTCGGFVPWRPVESHQLFGLLMKIFDVELNQRTWKICLRENRARRNSRPSEWSNFSAKINSPSFQLSMHLDSILFKNWATNFNQFHVELRVEHVKHLSATSLDWISQDNTSDLYGNEWTELYP